MLGYVSYTIGYFMIPTPLMFKVPYDARTPLEWHTLIQLRVHTLMLNLGSTSMEGGAFSIQWFTPPVADTSRHWAGAQVPIPQFGGLIFQHLRFHLIPALFRLSLAACYEAEPLTGGLEKLRNELYPYLPTAQKGRSGGRLLWLVGCELSGMWWCRAAAPAFNGTWGTSNCCLVQIARDLCARSALDLVRYTCSVCIMYS